MKICGYLLNLRHLRAKLCPNLVNSKILKILIQTILTVPLLLVLSTVFIVNKDFSNFTVTGKYFWFYASMGILAITSFIYTLRSLRPLRPLRNHCAPCGYFSVGIFVLWLAGLATAYFHNGFISNKFIILALLFPLYIYFRQYLSGNRLNAYVLVVFFIFTGLVEALWGLGQLYGFFRSYHSGFKITGSFFNPGPYSGYPATVFPCAFYYLLKYYRAFNKKPHLRYFPFYFVWILSALTVVSIILILPATMSRSSWTALAGGTALAIYLYYGKKRKVISFVKQHRKKIAFVSFLALSMLIIALSGMYYLKKDSADGRLLIWKTSAKVVLNHPFGVGLGNFCGAYGQQQAEYFASGQSTEQEQLVAGSPEYGFNEYFQICIEWGILPFLLFVAIIIAALCRGIKYKNPAAASLLSLLIFAASSYPFSVLPYVIVFVFLLALCGNDERKIFFNRKGRKVGAKFAINILCFMIVFLCLYNRYSFYEAHKNWDKAKIWYNFGLYNDVAEEYSKLYTMLRDDVRFLFEYSQALNKSEQYAESNRIIDAAVKISCDPMFYNIAGKNYQALKNYTAAEYNFKQAANIVPNRFYPYYLLAKLYLESEQMEKARQTAKIVLTKEAKINSPAINEMREEMKIMIND